jgi:hypothetical protein
MVRNRESWDWGEPELNDNGTPVIHDIAEKLGCIRKSPDMPEMIPQNEEESMILQAEMLAKQQEDGRRNSDDSTSPGDRETGATSIDSEQSTPSNDCSDEVSNQQAPQEQDVPQLQHDSGPHEDSPQFDETLMFENDFLNQEPMFGQTGMPDASPIFYGFPPPNNSPGFSNVSGFGNESPFTFGGQDGFLPGPNDPYSINSMTQLLMTPQLQQQLQQQQQQQPPPPSIPHQPPPPPPPQQQQQEAHMSLQQLQQNINNYIRPELRMPKHMVPTSMARANTFPPQNGDRTVKPNMLAYNSEAFVDPWALDFGSPFDFATMSMAA